MNSAVFRFNSKDFMLSKEDSVSFLFEDKRIIEFVFDINSYKIEGEARLNNFENKVPITDDELKHFAEINFLKWKIINKKQKRELFGGKSGFGNYESNIELVIVVKKLAQEYRKLVRDEIPNYTPLLKHEISYQTEANIDNEECYVYLMIDIINNYHKIGISNNPEWREKTLQSEKPTIELVAAKKFINRKIASSFEKALHNAYSNKRHRGEWFHLDQIEIDLITKTLKD